MNASDIIKAKQSQTLYRAYHQPNVFESSIVSTITPISSFINYISSGVPITSTSYASCTKTVLSYSCQPTFVTYESRQATEEGAFSCGGRVPSKLQWKNTTSTLIYSYSTIYSSLNTPSTIVPSTVRVTSTFVQTAPMPRICPAIQFQQGTYMTHSCPSCTFPLGAPGACCEQCGSS